MSRIGRMPIVIPAGVTVSIEDHTVTVKGPKGELSSPIHHAMNIEENDGHILVTRPDDEQEHRSLHGLTRALINNMVVGVTEGYRKELTVAGVGYRAQKQGTQLVLNIGFSHQVFVDETDKVKIDVPAPNTIVLTGIDKQALGQFAADVRAIKPPEPYKGKGIRYANEVIRLKEGKTGAKKK